MEGLGESMKITEAKKLLKKYYGYDEFRRGQSEIIDHILAGNDVLGIMPTGAGKSICYQIPALMQEGITIVISPLISLMKDQVDTLCEMGIKAAFVNSSLSVAEFRNVITNAKMQMYKLIYVAPERLETDIFLELIQSIKVSMVAVDEAHCVSQWGHDFRPSYRKISKMIEKLDHRPVLAAFTATATPQVKDDITKLLKLKHPFTLITGFDRENLYFEVLKPADKFTQLLQYLNCNKDKSGIIYASTRKAVEAIYEKLNKKGYISAKYHAGLTENERSKTQEDFLCDRVQVMVATNAFGMGIDKSNISFVIHYNMPKNMESYYQEAGRAGRDGERAECILYYSPADIITNRLLIENGSDSYDKAGEYQKLNEITAYCNTDRCLRGYILDYFGETDNLEQCSNCSNCNNDIEATDVTIEAQKIMSCVRRMGERFGSVLVTEVLRGSNTQKIRTMGFDQLSTYGIMKEYAKETIKELISFLIAEGYLVLTGDQYPVLRLSATAIEVLRGNKSVAIKRVLSQQKTPINEGTSVDNDLFDILKVLRKRIAEEQNIPPFVVFSDATLKGMSRTYPLNEEALLKIPGVGAFKLEKYGEMFISVVKSYVEEHDIKVEEKSEIKPLQGKSLQNKELKIDTRTVSYDLFKSGLSIEEIAAKRELVTSTIEGHLLDCLERGMALDFDRLVSNEIELQVIEVIKNCGEGRLKAIKEALPEEISYGTIKFVLYKCKR